jgi:hypothetical protein
MTEHAEPPAAVTVPDFHGRQALDAWLVGHDIGLLCQGPNPDSARPLLHGRVVYQRPLPGTTIRRWDVVTLWVRDDPGDLGGDREPRDPLPTIRHDLAARHLPDS